MRHKTLKVAQAALAKALEDLEAMRMTRHDDPALSALKEDIRRLIPLAEPKDEVSQVA